MKQSNIINLESILDLSARLNETYNEQFILNTAMLSLMGKLKVLRAAVFLTKNNETYELLIAKGKKNIEIIPYFDLNNFRELDRSILAEDMLFQAGYRFCLPVRHQEENLALICLGSSVIDGEFSNEELNYAWIVTSVAATALKNTYNHNSLLSAKTNLEQRNQLLSALFEMNREFSTLLSKSQIIQMMSYRLMGQLAVTRFSLFLFDGDGNPTLVINRFAQSPPDEMIKELSKFRDTIFSDNIEICIEIKELLQNIGVDVISPMIVQGELKGMLLVGKKMTSNLYSDENVLFLEALGNTAILALENERLFHEEVIKKQLESELNLALEIQRNLLPKETPKINRYEIAGLSIPSRQVGGDYYDFIKLDNERLLIAIADVSGKGMPASLLMANLQAALRVLTPLSLNLKELVSRLNNIVYQNTTAEKFVTFFCGVLDSKTNEFEYVNAGHNPPYLFRKDSSIEELTEGGMILGFLDSGIEYSNGKVQISEGDSILMFTDGVTEAMNEKHEEFDEKRVKELLPSLQKMSPEEFLDHLVIKVKEFAVGVAQYDDLTAIAVKSV
jgi:sigma-B regulation protein RsbU (phosphoserine phosphatase)